MPSSITQWNSQLNLLMMSNQSRRRPSHYVMHIQKQTEEISNEAIVPRNEYENRSKSTFWQGGKENEGPTH